MPQQGLLLFSLNVKVMTNLYEFKQKSDDVHQQILKKAIQPAAAETKPLKAQELISIIGDVLTLLEDSRKEIN